MRSDSIRRAWVLIAPLAVWLLALATVAGAHGQDGTTSGGWTIPADAATLKSPLPASPAVLAAGKKLFGTKCQRCHGPEGKGDGPDGEPEHQEDMDLTVASRAARNPDGVVFYKIWNGRTSPKMPTFSDDITKEQAWAIVAYVQTLRAKQ
jgi:mono/diheme cytochrome c family protein